MTNYRMPSRDRYCVMESSEIRPGRWSHVCVKCAVRRESIRPIYAWECELFYRGMGSRVAKMLKIAGVTPERISKIIGKPCGCPERRERLDRLDFALRRRIKRLGLKLPWVA